MADRVDALIEQYGVQRVVDALAPVMSDERRGRIECVLDARLASVTVALEDLYDPHNGAACIRSAEAMGLSELFVAECAQAFRFAPKITIGCDKWLAIHRFPRFAACAAALRERGFALWAAVPGAGVPPEQHDVSRPVAIVFGNEHAGLTEQAIAACDHAFSIPMFGFTQSFNLSVSAAITLQSVATRRRAHIAAGGDLDSKERAYLRARWYALSVRGADGIVARFVSDGTHSTVAAVTRGPED